MLGCVFNAVGSPQRLPSSTKHSEYSQTPVLLSETDQSFVLSLPRSSLISYLLSFKMKFTAIFASLAIAGTAAAAAIPNLDVAQIQSTVTRLDGVLNNIDGAIGSGAASRSDLGDTQNGIDS